MGIVNKNYHCRIFFDQVKLFHAFFSRFKVRKLYEGKTIPLLIEQRWSGHYKAILAIKNNFDQLFNALIAIKDGAGHNLDAEDVIKAIGLLDSMTKKKFMFLLGFLCKLLGIMEPANQILQRRYVGYRQAIIQAVKENVKTDESFDDLLNVTKEKRDTIEYVPIPRPRRIRRRSSRLSEPIVMFTIGEGDFDDDEESSLKR